MTSSTPKAGGGTDHRTEIAGVLHRGKNDPAGGIPSCGRLPEGRKRIPSIYCNDFLQFVNSFCNGKNPFRTFFLRELFINAVGNEINRGRRGEAFKEPETEGEIFFGSKDGAQLHAPANGFLKQLSPLKGEFAPLFSCAAVF